MGLNEDELAEEIRKWAEENSSEANKGPDQIAAEQKTEKYRDYLAAKTAADNAPSELSNAKESYLRLKYGSDYDSKRKEDYRKEAQKIADEYTEEHVARMYDATRVFKMYSAVAKFAAQSVEDFNRTLKSHVAAIQESDAASVFKTTSQRKTYYINQGRGTLEGWDTLLTLLLTSIGFVYAYHFFYINRQFKNKVLWLGLVLIWLSSYLLPKIINWILRMPRPINVYTSYAQTSRPDWHGEDSQ
jgi:hypothetical protein